MSDYTAPLKELTFALETSGGLDELNALPAFAEATTELAAAVLEEAGKLAADVLAPLNAPGDRQGVAVVDRAVRAPDGFADAYRQFAEGGWLALAQPESIGGQGLPFTLHMATSECWNSANMSLALCPMLSVSAIEALHAHASDDIKAKFLAPLVSAQWTGTMNLTEPQAGSDLAAVTTRAEPDGDHYRITGQKIYISWGDHDLTDNILHLALARLPDAPPGTKGISLFLVPKFLVNDDGSLGERNDVYPVSVEHKMGIHASPTCVMEYGESGDGAVGYLVGEPNNGLACMFTMMNHARLEVGLEGTALAERALQAASWYAHDRKQGRAPGIKGQAPIVHHADIKRMLLTMRALTEAARALGLYASKQFDLSHALEPGDPLKAAESRLQLLTPIVKAWCTEIAQEVTSLGIQVFGGMGYVEETGVAQFYRDARITPIYEGTNGIQAADFIGRKVLREGGITLKTLLGDMRDTAATLAGDDNGAIAAIGTALGDAVVDLAATADDVLARAEDDAEAAGAQAVDFLMQSGYVIGGWLLARQAAAAVEQRDSGELGADFYDAKLATARHYAARVLPRSVAHGHAARADTRLVTDVKEGLL